LNVSRKRPQESCPVPRIFASAVLTRGPVGQFVLLTENLFYDPVTGGEVMSLESPLLFQKFTLLVRADRVVSSSNPGQSAVSAGKINRRICVAIRQSSCYLLPKHERSSPQNLHFQDNFNPHSLAAQRNHFLCVMDLFLGYANE